MTNTIKLLWQGKGIVAGVVWYYERYSLPLEPNILSLWGSGYAAPSQRCFKHSRKNGGVRQCQGNSFLTGFSLLF